MPKIKKTKAKKIKKTPKKKPLIKKVNLKKKKFDKKAVSAPLRIANSNKYTPEEKVEIKK